MYTIKKILLASVLGLFLCGTLTPAYAGKFTVQTKINWLRSYLDGSYFVNVTSNKITGAAPCTTVYKVVSAQPGAKTIIATLLSAQAANRNIIIEIDNAGCQGWGTQIISVFTY